MAQFTEDVKVCNKLSGRVHEWVLLEPMSYYIDDPQGATVIVAKDFATDFASVPRIFWWWLAPWGRHGRAAIIHDWLYQRGTIVYPNERPEDERPSRTKSDRIFREAMEVLDNVVFTRHKFWGRSRLLMNLRLAVALPRRWLVWLAVRLFGAGAYRP